MALSPTTSRGSGVTELAYVEFTSDVSITAATEGTAQTVVAATSLTYDGVTEVEIEFYSEGVASPGGAVNRGTFLILHDGTSAIGRIGDYFESASSAVIAPCHIVRRFTPSAGTRAYSIRAFVTAGTGTVRGGAGGAGVFLPGFVRITSGD